MIGALIILAAVGLVGLVLWLLDRRHDSQVEEVPTSDISMHDGTGECCGMHAVCEKDTTPLQAEYFNDEELDAYIGRPAEDYSPAEVEEFRDVMLTLRPEERALWAVAIERRGIAVPEQLRDELIMLIEDA